MGANTSAADRQRAVAPADSFLALADLLPEPLALARIDGTVVHVSRAFTRTFGWTAGELPTLASALASGWTDALTYLRYCAGTRQLLPGGITLRAKNGTTILCRSHGAVFEPATRASPAIVLLRLLPRERKTSSFVALSSKIQELSAEILRRRAAEERANDALRVKEQFLATLSHELRTPINAIAGWAQIAMLPAAGGDFLRQALQTIARNAASQARMVDDLLQVSGATAGKLRLDLQPVSVPNVVQGALDTLAVNAAEAGIEMRLAVDGGVPLVNGDAERLQQIVWNLVSNALKFTPAGGRIEISVSCDEGWVRAVVSDTGEGIPPEFLPHVFGWFRQGDPTTTRTHAGLGIGLALVQHLVTAHGGQVRIESAGRGSGTTVTVELPALEERGAAGPATPL